MKGQTGQGATGAYARNAAAPDTTATTTAIKRAFPRGRAEPSAMIHLFSDGITFSIWFSPGFIAA